MSVLLQNVESGPERRLSVSPRDTPGPGMTTAAVCTPAGVSQWRELRGGVWYTGPAAAPSGDGSGAVWWHLTVTGGVRLTPERR